MRALTLFVVIIYVIICFIDVSQNMKVVPLKANITYLNAKYVKYATLAVKRYGRKSDYYMNLDGYKYHTWGNNFTLHLIFNEFLHNEYRRSFVEMHHGLCDLMKNDLFVGAMISSFKLTCPVVEKDIHLINMTVPTQKFSYQVPFEKSRVDAYFTFTSTGEKVAEGHIFLLFKQ